LGYTRSQLDTLLIGERYGSSATGKFKVVIDFVMMPKTEIIDPALRPLFISIASMKESDFNDYCQRVLFYFVVVLTPFCFFFFFNGESFVNVVLGEGWLSASVIASYLGFLTLPLALQAVFIMLMDKRGYIKKSFLFDIIAILYLLSFVYFLNPLHLEEFINIRIVVALLSFSTVIAISITILKFNTVQLLSFLLIPIGVIYSISYLTNLIVTHLVNNHLLALISYFLLFTTLFISVFCLFFVIARNCPNSRTLLLICGDIEKLHDQIKARLPL